MIKRWSLWIKIVVLGWSIFQETPSIKEFNIIYGIVLYEF